jgi:hypothetical protein
MLFEKLFKPPKKVFSFERPRYNPVQHRKITSSVEKNVQTIAESIGSPADLVIHNFTRGSELYGVLIYLDSLTDSNMLSEHVIKPIKNLQAYTGLQQKDFSAIKDFSVINEVLSAASVNEFSDLKDACNYLLSGGTLLFLQGWEKVLAVTFPGFPRRPVQEPVTEKTIKGPKEGFTEVLKDNIGMVRRWIRDPNLQLEKVVIGERTSTDTVVMYLKDVANPDIVAEVHKRLKKINIDGIVDAGYISELITDNRLTLFPLVQETERPDKVVASLLEGRVTILVDQSPFAIIVPVTSTEFYQTPADFYYNYWTGSFLRFIRAVGTLIAVTLPGLYAAVISINPEMIPPRLVQVIASGRVLVPFPVLVETLIALLILEIFREASIRIPGNINLILGIAGGVLLGQGAMGIRAFIRHNHGNRCFNCTGKLCNSQYR